jgi:hypothetical protein
MVYGETFLRNFKFYAKTLTKLHDLTVRIYISFAFLYLDVFIDETNSLGIHAKKLQGSQFQIKEGILGPLK